MINRLLRRPPRTIIRLRLNTALAPYILLEDRNGEILAPTQPYSTQYNARRAAGALQRRLHNSVVIDELEPVRA